MAEGGSAAWAGFLLTVGTAFGYAAGWTPYAADYTRYLPKAMAGRATDSSLRQGFSSCVILEAVGRRPSPSAGRPDNPD